MSLIFVPKIPERFKQKVVVKRIVAKPDQPMVVKPDQPKRKQRKWDKKELELIVNLRALNVSFVDIGAKLRRRPESCAMKVHVNELSFKIKERRATLLSIEMEKYNDTETN